MKKITSIFILLLSCNSLFGQIENFYSVAQDTMAYEPLVGAEEVILTQFTFSNLNVPFEFEYAGRQLGNIFFFNSGYLVLSGGTVTPQPNNITDIGQQNSGATSILAPLWDGSLRVPSGNTNSKRKTLLSGDVPNRTYTVEWENILWSSTGNEVSFRIIFEETTNTIIFQYGPNLSTEDVSASIGMNTEFSNVLSFLSITPELTPLASSTLGNNSVSSLDYPGEGISYVFTYTPPTCNIPAFLDIEDSTLTPESVEVRWVNGDSETEWEILLTDLSGGTSEVITANSNPFLIENINENSNYSIAIRAICSTLDTSEYSAQTFFTTPAICPKPITLNETAIGLTTASFTWAPGDAETFWEVAITLLGEPEPNSGLELDVTNYDATNLIMDTDYVFYVRANCGGVDGFSEWSTLNFVTAATCIAPSNVIVSNETCNSAIMSWTSNNTETSWEVIIEPISGNQATIIATTDQNPYLVTNLTPNRTFRVFVRAICSPTDISRRSRMNFIRTIADTINPIARVRNINLELDASGNASIEASDIDDNSVDDCMIDRMTLSKSTFDCTNLGENSVTLTVFDLGARSNSAEAIVTVIDAISPNAFCVDPFEVQLDDSGTVTITLSDINNNSNDNCEIQFIDIDKLVFDTNDIGENIVTLTVEDSSNNLSICTTVVTVLEADTFFVIEDYVTNLSNPRGLAFDQDEILYVAEHTTGNILRVTDPETFTQFSNTGFRNNNIVFNLEDNLLTTDDSFSQIFQIDNTGESSLYTALPNNSSPYGIATNSTGDLFVSFTNQGRIVKIEEDLTVTDFATGFFQPEGIVFDSNDNLFIADRGDRTLFKIDSDGVRTTIASNVPSIRAVAVDSEDNIYYNNSPSNPSLPTQIIKYDALDNTSSVLAEIDFSTIINELEFDNRGNLFIAYENQVGIIRNVAPATLSIGDVLLENSKIILINTMIIDNKLMFAENIKAIEIYNLSGGSVYNREEFGDTFILPTLGSGIYILKIKDANNNIIIEKIIER